MRNDVSCNGGCAAPVADDKTRKLPLNFRKLQLLQLLFHSFAAAIVFICFRLCEKQRFPSRTVYLTVCFFVFDQVMNW